MVPVPTSHENILTARSFANVATVDGDGVPQVTPVWFSTKNEYILINSAAGRKKDRNLRRNPAVALSIQDPADPYRYLGIQGEVVEITEEGAEAHIHALAQKYWGRPFDLPPGQTRVIYKIKPLSVWTEA